MNILLNFITIALILVGAFYIWCGCSKLVEEKVNKDYEDNIVFQSNKDKILEDTRNALTFRGMVIILAAIVLIVARLIG